MTTQTTTSPQDAPQAAQMGQALSCDELIRAALYAAFGREPSGELLARSHLVEREGAYILRIEPKTDGLILNKTNIA